MSKIYYYFFNFFFRFCAFTFRWRAIWRFWWLLITAILVLIRYRNSVLTKNLEIVFGNHLPSKQMASLRRKVYQFLSYETCYFFSLISVDEKELKNRTKIIANQETLKLCQQKKPMILLSGHTLGIWIGALFAVCFRYCCAYTYHGPQKDSYEIYNLFQKIASRFCFKVVPQSTSDVFTMRKCLKNNHCLSIVGDLNVQHTSVFVDFFGKPASVGEGAFRIALRAKVPIVFAHITEDSEKNLIFSLEKIYEPTKETPEVKELATRFIQKLEKKILQNPVNYFWTNKRWKTRPSKKKEDIYS